MNQYTASITPEGYTATCYVEIEDLQVCNSRDPESRIKEFWDLTKRPEFIKILTAPTADEIQQQCMNYLGDASPEIDHELTFEEITEEIIASFVESYMEDNYSYDSGWSHFDDRAVDKIDFTIKKQLACPETTK